MYQTLRQGHIACTPTSRRRQSVIAGLLLRKFPPRVVSMAGGMIIAIGVLLCAAFYNITGIILCYGLLVGFGQGLVCLSNECAINTYFNKYRASASGINWAGSSLATFVFSSVIVYLNDQYGLRGTFVIVGGLTLNAAAGCLLMANPEDRVKKPELPGSGECVNGDIDEKVQGKWYNSLSHRTVRDACGEKKIIGFYAESNTSVALSSVPTETRIKMSARNASPRDMPHSSQVEQNYTGEAGREKWPRQKSKDIRNGEGGNANTASCVRKSTLVSVVCSELGFLKRPIVHIIMLSTVVYASVSALYAVTLADHAMGQGLYEWQAALVVSCCGVGEIIAQLLSGQISDRKVCQRRHVMAISFLLMASSLVAVIYVKSMALFVLVALFYGPASGGIQMLIAVITVEYLGLKNLPLASSFYSLACALVAFPRPLLIGYYRDRRGSYAGLYVLLGALCFAVGLIWTIECLLQWRASKKLREEAGPPEKDAEIVGVCSPPKSA
ncbi:monocarboxylate transporter 9-like isoform X2 [Haemaphysalis longicornis]